MQKTELPAELMKKLSACMIDCAQAHLINEAQVIGAVIKLLQQGHKEKLALILGVLADELRTPEEKQVAMQNVQALLWRKTEASKK